MTIVIGLPRDERVAAAVNLGGMLARSFDEDVVVCTVVPPPWPPGMGKVDAEYQQFLDADAAEALEDARDLMPDDVRAEYVVAAARSTSAGLLEVAGRHGAGLLALGSSTAGALGRVAFGSVAERLLHISPLPVALAPRGFRCRPGHRVGRVTAAYGASEGSDELVVTAAEVASRVGASLRVASFAVRSRTPLTAGIGSRAEDSVLQVWSAEVAAAQQKVLDDVAQMPHPPHAEAVIGHGRDWTTALEDIGWDDGDLLTVGSSTTAPVARVFIGSRSSKIVRHSPVPVMVIPRGARP
jgi:nucleotide-binding universal stress UspA family protein